MRTHPRVENELLGSGGILNVCSNEDGSNAILLPEKNSKTKGAGKISKKGKPKGLVPSMSKSKQRKLKQLQEEKERKALQSKSIELLERYKIRDDAYSLLHSSGTIGQVESMREKRLRAVQFSKAGLEVPEDVLPYRKKIRDAADRESEVTVECNSEEIHLDKSGCDDSPQPKKTEIEGLDYVRFLGSHPKPICKGPRDRDIGSYPVLPTLDFADEETGACTSEEKKNPPFVSCSYKRKMATSQNHERDGSNVDRQNASVPPDFIFNKSVDGPIIVHVSRPSEVESKRRDLPIVMMEQEIMEAINENSILIICGETGCGKTTQVPQFLYEAGFGSRSCSTRKGIIGVTQPRRVAVLATAKRVSFELGLRLGKEVGFQVRHDKRIGENCSIKFMTDGILLREVQSDFLLKQYSIIILDEAHERSLNTDILIGMLSRVIQLRQKLYMEQREKILSGVKISDENMITQLKLVLMSATLRVEDFVDGRLFHEPPPIIEIPTRQFPVTIHFSKRTDTVDYVGQAYKKALLIHKRLPPGGILVFVTGQREVEYLCKRLRKASQKLTENSHMEKTNVETAAVSEIDMKEISEAFETGSHSPNLEHDVFSSYKEDYDDFCSSDSMTEGETVVDSDDESFESSEKNDSVLDFLREPMSLASLKASFESLAGDVPDQNGKKGLSLHISPTVEEYSEKSPVSAGALKVLPLYAMLPASKQLQVFEDVGEGERLVVVATNVAETSLTIPGIKYVVDTGREKVKNYNYANGMATYEVQWISKASAAQRAGRAGRTGPGHCYRLYSSAVFSNILSEFSNPEISKIPVDGVVLLMKSMGIDKVENFPFPTPPETSALQEAESCLKALEVLDGERRLTYIGKAMARYPMSPRHSRMLLTVIQIMRNQQGYARANLVLGYAVASVAALSFSNPFIMHLEGSHENTDDLEQDSKSQIKNTPDKQEKHRQKKQKAMLREVRKRFSNPVSDALTISYALQLFELAESQVEFCSNNLLNFKTMDEMSKLRKQLLQMVFHQNRSDQEFSWNHGNFVDVECAWRIPSDKHPLAMNEEELLGQAICAGWADRVAKRIRTVSELSDKDRNVRAVRYQSSALNETVFLHHSSSVSQTAPDFLVYTELLHTKRPYMHGATSVKLDWLVKYSSSLCSFSAPLTDPKPYYEPLTDQVMCWVSPTFGPHLWQLPLHSLPIRNDMLRLSVFACSLLEGNVLPCLRPMQKFLAAPPSTILRPQASGQRRVGDLLNKLKTGSRVIDSRAMLRETWHEHPQMLHSEIKCWFQEKFHNQFEQLWLQMHHEVLLEVRELYPKQSNKGKTRKGKWVKEN